MAQCHRSIYAGWSTSPAPLPGPGENLCPSLARSLRRDGLERIQVPDDATVAQLKTEINRVLAIPTQDMALSKDAKLVCSCSNKTTRLAAPHNHDGRGSALCSFETKSQPITRNCGHLAGCVGVNMRRPQT